MTVRLVLLVGAAMATAATPASGQTVSEPDHRLVLEAGATAHRAASGGPVGWGGSVAAELTPFEGGVEFELGLEAVSTGGEHETSVDFLPMKSWQLSRAVELMVGAGPELSWHSGVTSLAAEVVGHLMYWPRHAIGLFVEPGFSLQPTRNGERSVGLAAGLLIAIS